MVEKDPGVQGKKLSKSSDDVIEKRNKSYEKILDLEIAWIHAANHEEPDAEDLRIRWSKKREWHEKEFGW